jgi:hypothetical protein
VSTVINALAAALVSGQQQQQDTKVMSMLREVMGVMKGAEGVMVNTGQEVRDALTAQMKCVECAVVDAMHTQAQEVKDSVVTSIAEVVRSNGQELSCQVKNTEGVLLAALQAHGQDVTNSVAQVMSGIRNEMLHLITSVTASVQASVQQLDTTHVVNAVSDKLKTWVAEKSNVDYSVYKMNTAFDELNKKVDHLDNQVLALPDWLDISQRDMKTTVNETKRQLCVFEQQHQNICSRLLTSVQGIAREEGVNTTKVLDVLRGSFKEQRSMLDEARGHLDSLERGVNRVVGTTDNIYESQMRHVNNARIKGMVAENELFELLRQRLPKVGGFIVTRVTGKSHSCDFLVQREGRIDIRIENKAHHRDSTRSYKVTTKEVDRFIADVTSCNDCHGIFISQHAGIVDKRAPIDWQRLPYGKLAVYISNCEYDMDMVCAQLEALYCVDTHLHGDYTSLSAGDVQRIQQDVGALGCKLQQMQAQAKSLYDGLNAMTFESIRRTIDYAVRGLRPASSV